MFGYVRVHKSEMLVREYDQYKAVYCELCRRLGKSYGALSRLTLSYDCTFYALLALSVSGAKVKLHEGRCTTNPLKKCSYIEASGEEYEKAAALSVLLTCHKLRDNIEDESFFKSFGSRLLLFFFKRAMKKAEKRYPFQAELARRAMDAQAEAERERAGIDACAEPSAQLLSSLFEELAGCDKMQGMALSRFGYFLGRWVYLMDAADDLADDIREGSFNPFAAKLGLEGKKELSEDERREADIFCNETLNATVAQMLLPLNLIEMENFGPIIENVAHKGIPEMQREILFLHIRERKKRSGPRIK